MSLDKLFQSLTMTRIATGFEFTEGPVWHPEGYLLFSDIPADTIYRVEPDHSVSIWRQPSGNSNGLTFDRRGQLVACQHGNRRVTVTMPEGDIRGLATHYQGNRLNSPNDVVVRSDNSVYFTDPPYGIQERQRELSFNGVYRITPDGEVILLVDDMGRPNGLAFSPDESVLYVDDSERRHIRAFDVAPDGSVSNDRIWADMSSPDEGSPDGMKVDIEGNVYCTGPGGLWVFTPSAERIGIVRGPEQPANLAFGDRDRRKLYITARTSLYTLRTEIPGVPVF